MPEEKDAMWFSSHEATPVHYIRKSLQDRHKEYIIFFRIIFQVSILNDRVFTTGMCNTGNSPLYLRIAPSVLSFEQSLINITSFSHDEGSVASRTLSRMRWIVRSSLYAGMTMESVGNGIAFIKNAKV
jgi:hypothetical protein